MRYFFDIVQHNQVIIDPDGSELPDDASAVEEALASARDLIIHDLRNGGVIRQAHIEVRKDGSLIASVPLRSAFKFEDEL